MGFIKDIDETQAPLLEHLIELRGRLLRAVAALAVAFFACLYFAKDIIAFLVQPLLEAGQDRLIYTRLYGQFFVELKVALWAAFFVSFPVIANQLWAFIAPGLYAKEKKAFLPFLLATPILFLAGGSLAYFVVMPTAFHWFLGFEGRPGGIMIEALPNSEDYLGLVMQFVLAFGLSFLLPVLLLLLNVAGIVKREQLVRARRYMIVLAFVIAAVATPPDVISQLMLAIPLWALFEGSLLAMRFLEKKDAHAEPEAGAAAPTE